MKNIILYFLNKPLCRNCLEFFIDLWRKGILDKDEFLDLGGGIDQIQADRVLIHLAKVWEAVQKAVHDQEAGREAYQRRNQRRNQVEKKRRKKLKIAQETDRRKNQGKSHHQRSLQ